MRGEPSRPASPSRRAQEVQPAHAREVEAAQGVLEVMSDRGQLRGFKDREETRAEVERELVKLRRSTRRASR